MFYLTFAVLDVSHVKPLLCLPIHSRINSSKYVCEMTISNEWLSEPDFRKNRSYQGQWLTSLLGPFRHLNFANQNAPFSRWPLRKVGLASENEWNSTKIVRKFCIGQVNN